MFGQDPLALVQYSHDGLARDLLSRRDMEAVAVTYPQGNGEKLRQLVEVSSPKPGLYLAARSLYWW